jgi:hypothetical protein
MRKLAFPVMFSPGHLGGRECAIIVSKPIEDARPGVAPSQCYVVGVEFETGQAVAWNVPIVDFQAAVRAAVTFVDVDNMRAPTHVYRLSHLRHAT